MSNLLLFDLEPGGHHPSYLYYFSAYWKTHQIPHHLYIVVSPKLLEQIPESKQLEFQADQSSIQFVPITPSEATELLPRKSSFLSLRRALQEWKLLGHYAQKLSADHCLLMYLDRTHLPIILRQPLPCSFSSIYFRPTFHYHTFKSHQITLKQSIQAWREQIQLFLGLSHPRAQTLFCLDPFAVPYINQRLGGKQAVYLPDPVPLISPRVEDVLAIRARLDIEPPRQVFLLFGALDQRKGIYQILDAIEQLSNDAASKICLLLVGKLKDTVQESVLKQIQHLRDTKPVQIVAINSIVPEEDIPIYFQLSDIVLAAYQQHVGMSGILVRAAAAGKPLICCRYGLMGEMTHRYRLGLRVEAESSNEIAQAMLTCLKSPAEELGDVTKMKAFAQQNAVDKFAEAIIKHVCMD
jgi:glycosyltransferase involved in cell wall biosynthesis